MGSQNRNQNSSRDKSRVDDPKRNNMQGDMYVNTQANDRNRHCDSRIHVHQNKDHNKRIIEVIERRTDDLWIDEQMTKLYQGSTRRS